MTRRVVLHWPSFGPYHTARLKACAEAAPRDVEVVGLAVAGQVEGRPWVPDSQEGATIRVETLFPDAMYHELPRRQVAAAMAAALDRLRPDAIGISGYGMTDSRAALRWAVRAGATRVLMTESKADDAPRQWWKEWLKRRLVAKFDSGLCGGTPHRAYLEQLGMRGERIFDRYDVVDNARFAAAARVVRESPERFRNLPGLGDRRPYFLVSSRFIARKNLERMVRAFAAYRRDRPAGWRLVILGGGPEGDVLRNLVTSESIPDVDFAGFHQFDGLVAYYALAGAFVHPAQQEQWGLVINEAMACGLPVLASRTAGASYDLVKDEINGFRFDPLDVSAISDALARIADDPVLRNEMAARSLEIVANWTPRHFAENFWRAVWCGGRWQE